MLCRRLHRHSHRRAPRHRLGSNDVSPFSGHLRDESHLLHHHDGGHLLRGDVWRLNDFHSRQHSWRGRLGCDLPGWSPDGAPGAGRPGPWDCGFWFFHRRDLQRCRNHAPRASACQYRPALRSSGDLRPSHPRLHNGDLPRQGIEAQVCSDGYPGTVLGHDRARPDHRNATLHLREHHSHGWPGTRTHDHGTVRYRGGPAQHRKRAQAGSLSNPD